MQISSRYAQMKRRDFVRTLAATAVTAAARPGFAAGGAQKRALRACFFADIHYFPGIWPHGSREWLERILVRAETEKTDMVVHLGDFVHDPVKDRDYVEYFNNFSRPTYHVLGNHDGERTTLANTLDIFGMKGAHYLFDRDGFRFIVADPNYFVMEGRHIHYEGYNLSKALKTGKVETVSSIPPEQVEWIRSAVEESPYPCVFLSHESVERRGSVANGQEIRNIFDDANRRHPGRVRLVVNGHHHADYVSVINDIVYLDLNSASYQYYVKPHSSYPTEYIARCRNAAHSLTWNDPLSAIVTLDPEGGIAIEGSESTFMYGVTPEKAGVPLRDPNGRVTVPCIRSFSFKKKFMV